jgi:anti-anti-sigma factor
MPEDAAVVPFAMSATLLREDTVLVEIRGNLDRDTVARTRAFLAEVTTDATRHLVIDLAGVGFLDASGEALLIAADCQTGGIHGSLHLLGVTANPPVEGPLTAIGLIDFVEVVPDLDTFLAGLGDAGPPRSDA